MSAVAHALSSSSHFRSRAQRSQVNNPVAVSRSPIGANDGPSGQADCSSNPRFRTRHNFWLPSLERSARTHTTRNIQPNHHDHSSFFLFADRKVFNHSRILSICASKLPFVAVSIPVTVLIFFLNGSRHRTLRSTLTRHYSASTSTHTSCASTSRTLCLKTMRHRRCMTRAPDI